MDKTRFSELLRQFRQAAGLSQGELAERAGLSAPAISAMERGVRRAPYPDTLDALATALGLSADDREDLLAAAQPRRGSRAPARPRAIAPPPEPRVIDVPEAGLIGRATAFAEVVALVRHAGVRLLTIAGLGGVGKTRLALAVARALAADFAEAAATVLLADLRDPAQVPAQIGRAVGLADRAPDPVTALREHLRDRHQLLVLDNCEQLLAAAPLVAELLDTCPRLVVLATSRVPLRLARERVYELSPLDCPDLDRPIAPAALAEFGAPALFVARARVMRPGIALTEANGATIAAICARLDGLPLAIELAAARLNVLTPAELLDRLAARLPLLTRGPGDRPERQRTLRATLDWSYDLLNAGERALFRRLAAFTGGATLAAIEAVCAPPAPLAVELHTWLDGLVEQGLARREYTGDDVSLRYTMLETVREYAAEQLAAHGEEGIHQRRHADYFLAYAEEAERHLYGPEQAQMMAFLVADRENLRAALRWALDNGNAAMAIRFGAALGRFWYRTDAVVEGRGWFRAIFALPASDDGAALLRELSRAQRGAGSLAMLQTELDAAQEHHKAALVFARQAGDERLAARAIDALGIVAKERGDIQEAIARHEEALAILREIGEPWEIGITLSNLAGAYDRQGDSRRFIACTTEALTYTRASGDTFSTMIALINLGIALRQSGDYAGGRTYCEEGCALARQLGNALAAGTALGELCSIALDQGDAARAIQLAREVLEQMRPLGSGSRLAAAHVHVGEALHRLGDYDGAEAALDEGQQIATAIADDWSASSIRLVSGMVAEDRGEHERALEVYRAALEQARRIGIPWGITIALNYLGGLTPDPVEAAACFRESLDHCVAAQQLLHGAHALEGCALVTLAEGTPDRAARLLASAEAIRTRLGTPREPRWAARCADVADTTRATHGSGAFEAAWEDGRALHFEAAAEAARRSGPNLPMAPRHALGAQ